MAYVLLWIENLAAALLLVALALAFAARTSKGWRRAAVWISAALVPLAVYVPVAVLSEPAVIARWLAPLMMLALAYAVGVVLLRVFAFSRAAETPPALRAVGWSRARLAGALLVVLAVHIMTFWNLDLSIQQSLTSLRAEAGALALSAAPPRVPDRENAAAHYYRAFELMGLESSWPKEVREWKSKTTLDGQTFDAAEPELRQFLARKRPVLTLVHTAAAEPGCYFDRDYGRPSIDMLLPEVQGMRIAAWLLAVDSHFKAADGDLAGGLKNVDTMFAMAEHTSNGPILVSMIVATAIDRMAFDTLRTIIAAGTPEGEDLDKVRITESFSYRRTYHRTLRMEEAFGVSIFCDVATGQMSLDQLDDFSGARSSDDLWNVLSPLYRVFLLGDDLAAYRRYMRQFGHLATMSYSQARQDLDSLEEDASSARSGLISSFVLPALGRAAVLAASGDARRRIARVALASLRFRVREGRLPKEGKELVPEDILYVPKDPFDGAAIRIKSTDRGLTIYSVGPNRADDGGIVAEDLERHGDIAIRLPH